MTSAEASIALQVIVVVLVNTVVISFLLSQRYDMTQWAVLKPFQRVLLVIRNRMFGWMD